MGNLGSRRIAFQLRPRKRSRMRPQAVSFEPPVNKTTGLLPVILFALRGLAVHRGNLGYVAAIELAGHRMARHHDALRPVGQRLTHAVDAAMIPRDEPLVA